MNTMDIDQDYIGLGTGWEEEYVYGPFGF